MVPSMTDRSEWQTPAASHLNPDLVGPGCTDFELVGDLDPFTGVDDASHFLLLSLLYDSVTLCLLRA